MYLRLDSGANNPILYDNPTRLEPWFEHASAVRTSAIGGNTEFFKLMAPQGIRIGKREISDVVFAIPIASKQNGVFAGEDGLLPTSLFGRVFISYGGGFVVLEPRTHVGSLLPKNQDRYP